MHQADSAHVTGGAEAHDGKARDWLLEGVVDRAVPAHLSDFEAAGGDHGYRPHFGVGDNLDVPVVELGLTQVDDQSAHAYVDLDEAAHLPPALEADLTHRGSDLERLLTTPRGRSALDGEGQAAYHRGELRVGTCPEQPIEDLLETVQIQLAAGYQRLKEVNPALLQFLRDLRFDRGRQPIVAHVTRLFPGRFST